MYSELAILALIVFVYSTVAGRVERTVISGPMVFVVTGFSRFRPLPFWAGFSGQRQERGPAGPGPT